MKNKQNQTTGICEKTYKRWLSYLIKTKFNTPCLLSEAVTEKLSPIFRKFSWSSKTHLGHKNQQLWFGFVGKSSTNYRKQLGNEDEY